MAVCISVADHPPEKIWMISNRTFWWYAELLISRFEADDEVVNQVEIAEAIHGVSLDHLYLNDPFLALRLRDAFQLIAEEIAEGLHVPPDDDGTWGLNGQFVFRELVTLLDEWEPTAAD